MDYVALRTLIETHPTHASTSDADMAIWLNDPNGVTRDRTHLSNTDIQDIALSETAEWNALTEPERATFGQIIGIREQVPVTTGTPTRDTLQDILGPNTKATLSAALSENVSRAVDGGFPSRIREGDVTVARTA